MPIVIYGFVVSTFDIIGSIAILAGGYLGLTKLDELNSSDDEFVTSFSSSETDKKEAIETEANDAISAHNDFVATEAPVAETIQDPATVNPTTMPDYLAQQNELLQMQIQATKNLTAQSKFQNDLLSRSIQAHIVSNANSKMIAETLASSLPALVMQMQQVSKIPATMKIKSEIETTQHEEKMQAIKDDREFQATHAANHVNAINELKTSLSTVQQDVVNATLGVSSNIGSVAEQTATVATHTKSVADTFKEKVLVSKNALAESVKSSKDSLALQETSVSHSQSISNATNTIASNAAKQEELATIQTTVARITDLDGNVVAELKPWELSTYKDLTLAKAKEKEKEIGDYKTGYGEITNLDGTIIASVGTPLQMETIKHATDAKNATDEMEFEMPDDILDHLFQPFPLPAFTNYDYNKQNEFMFNGGSL